MYKCLVLLLVLILVFSMLLSGCTSNETDTTALSLFDAIKVNPEMYNGQTVTFTGYWFDGFEIVVVAEYLEPQQYWPGNYQPGGILIWVQGGLPDEVSSKLYLQADNPTGYPAHYGKVEVTGILEYGGPFGHMNAYQYQLQIQSARWIDWTPTND